MQIIYNRDMSALKDIDYTDHWYDLSEAFKLNDAPFSICRCWQAMKQTAACYLDRAPKQPRVQPLQCSRHKETPLLLLRPVLRKSNRKQQNADRNTNPPVSTVTVPSSTPVFSMTWIPHSGSSLHRANRRVRNSKKRRTRSDNGGRGWGGGLPLAIPPAKKKKHR